MSLVRRFPPLLAALLLMGAARAQEKPLHLPSSDAELWLSGAVELRFDEGGC